MVLKGMENRNDDDLCFPKINKLWVVLFCLGINDMGILAESIILEIRVSTIFVMPWEWS